MKLIQATLALTLIAAVSAGAYAAKPSAKSKYDGVEIKVITDRTSDGLMQPLFEAFERDTGIEIDAVFLDEGLVARIESRPTEADVIITKDAELIELAKELSDVTMVLKAGRIVAHGSFDQIAAGAFGDWPAQFLAAGLVGKEIS